MTIAYTYWAIARLREGVDANVIDLARLDSAGLEYLGVCRSLNGGDRRAAFDSWTRYHPDGKRILAAVFEVPAELVDYPEPATPAGADSTTVFVDVPDLPKAARLTQPMTRAATDTGSYLAEWTRYLKLIVDTLPTDWCEAGALSAWSIAVARRVHVATYFEPQVFPNLWVLWVAESTVHHKTTALNAHRRQIKPLMGHLLLPEEQSGDRLIQDMAGMDPVNYNQISMWDQGRWRKSKQQAGQRSIVIDEASSLFSGFRKDYNIGKVETFLKAYDCDDEKTFSTVRHGNIYLRHLYMTLLGATTPAAIQQAANLQMWEMGFWPRFILLVPERMFPDEPNPPDVTPTRPAKLDTALTDFLAHLPQPEARGFADENKPPKSIEATYTPEVWKHWTAFSKSMLYTLQHPDTTPDSRLRKMYGRMPVKLLQTATLLACMDWQGEGTPKIEMSHYARAHQVVEQWRINAHRFVEVMSRPLAGEDRERRLLTTIARIAAAGDLATTREVHRHTGWPRDQVEALLAQMERDALIEQADSDSKRTKVWKVRK